MTRLTEEQQHALLTDLMTAVKRYDPEWTAHQPHDPGITIKELIAWLADAMLPDSITLDEPSRTRLKKLLTTSTVELSQSSCDTSAKLTRPRYFSGQLLTADDFQAEQDYFRTKLKRHNRYLHGWGVVCGLEVTRNPKDSSFTISPGCAIDRNGEEIVICEPVECKLNATISVGYISLSFCEKPVAKVAGSPEPARIEEGVSVQFGQQAPEGSVTLVRLKRIRKRWIVDRRFRPKMVKRCNQ